MGNGLKDGLTNFRNIHSHIVSNCIETVARITVGTTNDKAVEAKMSETTNTASRMWAPLTMATTFRDRVKHEAERIERETYSKDIQYLTIAMIGG